jgi:hypothetical protein
MLVQKLVGSLFASDYLPTPELRTVLGSICSEPLLFTRSALVERGYAVQAAAD